MGEYTATILFYSTLGLALILFVFSAMTWDSYRDYQYRVMDQEKAKRNRFISTLLFGLAIVVTLVTIILYFVYPPHKVVTRTFYEKPETKNITVYRQPPPSELHNLRSTRVQPPALPAPTPAPQPPRRQVILLEEASCPAPCPEPSRTTLCPAPCPNPYPEGASRSPCVNNVQYPSIVGGGRGGGLPGVPLRRDAQPGVPLY